MDVLIDNVEPADLQAVLQLNDTAVPDVNRIDFQQLQWFCGKATYFRVARKAGQTLAFLIGLGPDIDYQSPNYQWFCARYKSFIYVDRVVVARQARQSGLASRLYDDFASTAADNAEVMVCEVNIKPANETSMQFHLRRGFRQVGSQTTEAGKNTVALLEKVL